MEFLIFKSPIFNDQQLASNKIQTLRLNRSTINKNNKFAINWITAIKIDESFSDKIDPVSLKTLVIKPIINIAPHRLHNIWLQHIMKKDFLAWRVPDFFLECKEDLCFSIKWTQIYKSIFVTKFYSQKSLNFNFELDASSLLCEASNSSSVFASCSFCDSRQKSVSLGIFSVALLPL